MNSLLLLMGSTVAANPPEAYWVSIITAVGAPPLDLYSDTRAMAIAANSDGSCVITGITRRPVQFSPSAVYTAKLNSDGTIAWQRATDGYEGRAATVDSSGNMYVNIIGGDDYGYSMRTIKYSPTGSMLWTVNANSGSSGAGATFATGITVSPTGYVYSAGRQASTSLLEIYNSSGVRQSGFNIVIGSPNVGLTSTDEILLAGTTGNDGVQGINATKLNSGGTSIVWQKKLVKGLIQVFASHFTSAGSVVLGGYGAGDNILALYNSSGVLQWQKSIPAVNYASIASDSSGNLYVCGTVLYPVGEGFYNDVGVIKFSPSGDVIWQRRLHWTATLYTSIFPYGASVVGNSLYISGERIQYLPGNLQSSALFTAKLPTDGSLTGTYSAFEYTTMSLTVSAGTAVESTDTLAVTPTPDPSFPYPLASFSVSPPQTIYPL